MNRVLIAAERDTTRVPSAKVWKGFPFKDIQEGYTNGYARHYDFTEFRAAANVNAAEAYWGDGFNLFGSDGAAVAVVASQTDGRAFGSDGDNEGVGLRSIGAPFQIDRGKKTFCLEACLQTSTVTDTKHGFVLGLSAAVAITATDPIAAAGTIADRNLIVFHRLEGDGDQLDIVYRADGQTAVSLDTDVLDGTTQGGGALPSALPAATDFKLGMRFFPSGHRSGDHRLVFYYNGIELPTSVEVPAADGNPFPNDVPLGPIFSLLNATASTPGTTTLKWIRYGQLY